MIRFDDFERLGLRLAGISDRSDGDCGWNTESGPANRKTLAGRLGLDPTQLIGARQVHSASVSVVTRADCGRGSLHREDAVPQSDALIARDRDVVLTILVADCVPVYLVDQTTGAIGLVHAGRLGTELDIVGATVDAMIRELGANPREMHALIGPSAGPERYEVSEEMACAWASRGLPGSGRMINLWDANKLQLVRAGVPAINIHVTSICTLSDPRFFSHRMDRSGRRNMAFLLA
ncbi:MAG: laccase domain protein [Candidatus Hydrogenedentota bacterium]